MRRDVFQAIADPTRRAIIERLAQEALNHNDLAGTFDMTRQAVTKHIKILEECGLLVIRQEGRERFCEARLEPLTEVAGWVEQYKKHWHQRFKSLDKYLHQMQNKKHDNK
ncbi:ArsR/SmtB family transcription factor [Deminuibacter soli]|uniref:ArsR family transcriptional regulator n=1 Tax=Deminuibacter soli TaxID=2291815 RepID=A0A3E1NES6_9BACT|nr:metalloregulator ArsR/SmtB family transcription factor [Deminuibacter soli]RFM26278.1 ArsR family transcriptional regulator [Deminuibacter soli]